MGPLPNLRVAFSFLALMVGVVGWAIIEVIIWLFSHIDISWME